MFWPAFRADLSRILGGVFDAMSGALRELPSVDLKELPRMADFAEWGEAVGRALGWGAGAVLRTYDENRREAADPILDDSPLGPLLMAVARNRVSWSGTSLELYQMISKVGGAKQLGPRWPKTVNMFGSELRKIAPLLRLNGLSIRFERNSAGRVIFLEAEGSSAAGGP